MVLMVFLSSRISPRTSTVILRDKSPFATAVVTAAMLRTWLVRLLAIEFTDSVKSFQTPATPRTTACPPLSVAHPESLVRMVQNIPRLGVRSSFEADYYRALRDHSTTPSI